MRIAQTFGINLRRLRKGLGITQEGLCEDLKISTPTLIRWEKGLNMPREEGQIDELADYLGVDPVELFQSADLEPKTVRPTLRQALEVVNEHFPDLVMKMRPKR